MTSSEYTGRLEYLIKEDETILWSGKRHHHVIELEYKKAKKAPIISLGIFLLFLILFKDMFKDNVVVGLLAVVIFGGSFSFLLLVEYWERIFRIRKYINTQPDKLDFNYVITTKRVLMNNNIGNIREIDISEIVRCGVEIKEWQQEYNVGDIELNVSRYSGRGLEEYKIELEAVTMPEYVYDIITKAIADYNLKKEQRRW